ncbi:hypothetical protein BDU57DRAFT_515608 [Ampelomyces quisqualis]|uniref:DUF7728 domain-containing protein n=1 Tax=Ampelomyces quisqualis TaxID=50730 RepID=A0A6A5QMX2_AMPQU|nr:hypothetical protein BDU57DRAFT_515608 [Ampelomyces quisqualis]
MSLNKVGIIASLVLAASAILPPLSPNTVIPDDLRDSYAAEGYGIEDFGLDLRSRSVALNCPGCAFATLDEAGISWKEKGGNTFLLHLHTSGYEDTVLQTETGHQLFPPSINDGKPSFYVTQVDPNHDEPLHLLVTSYTLRFNGARAYPEQGVELLPMALQIASVEGVAVELPILEIEVIKEASGSLLIASMGATQPTKEENCNEWPLLCKWKDIVAERIEKMKKMGKGCGKRPHGHSNPMMGGVWQGKPPHRFRPGRPHHGPHHGPHHMDHGHHSQHRVHSFARRAFFTVLIPIIVGVFAGTVTYLLGMVLGTMIAIVIAKVRGQEYRRIALEEDVEEGEAQCEKHAYGELPAYEAPPVYEASGEKVNESK